jgi:fatty-acid peroxygenase
VLLDVYGANHDARMWVDPRMFDPARFRDRVIGPFDFIPQGGGDSFTGHRCAGERLTIRQLEIALRVLTRDADSSVPRQNLDVSLRRIPTAPASGFVIEHVAAATSNSASRLPH